MSVKLRITVLGRLSVTQNDEIAIAPSAPKERKLLVLMLLNYDRIVPVNVIIDELWGSNPPRKSRAALQTYVLNIRNKLSRELGISSKWIRDKLFITNNEGYQFSVNGCHFDLQEYVRLTDLGERALMSGDDARGVTALRDAEKLWDGSILPDAEHGIPLRSEITRIEQRRLVTQELRIEGELRMGRHRQLVGELSMLTLRHPYHERLHEYLMLALCHSGRPVQALETFQRLRHSLVNEMGLEPSRRIQSLHEDILGDRISFDSGRTLSAR